MTPSPLTAVNMDWPASDAPSILLPQPLVQGLSPLHPKPPLTLFKCQVRFFQTGGDGGEIKGAVTSVTEARMVIKPGCQMKMCQRDRRREDEDWRGGREISLLGVVCEILPHIHTYSTPYSRQKPFSFLDITTHF